MAKSHSFAVSGPTRRFYRPVPVRGAHGGARNLYGPRQHLRHVLVAGGNGRPPARCRHGQRGVHVRGVSMTPIAPSLRPLQTRSPLRRACRGPCRFNADSNTAIIGCNGFEQTRSAISQSWISASRTSGQIPTTSGPSLTYDICVRLTLLPIVLARQKPDGMSAVIARHRRELVQDARSIRPRRTPVSRAHRLRKLNASRRADPPCHRVASQARVRR